MLNTVGRTPRLGFTAFADGIPPINTVSSRPLWANDLHFVLPTYLKNSEAKLYYKIKPVANLAFNLAQ